MNGEITSASKETEKLREKSSAISDQIKELQNKILEVGGVKLRAIQSKVSTTKGLLDLANESITKTEVGQAKAERDVEKLEKALAGNKANMEEVNAELQAVDGDLAACSADLTVIKEKVQEVMDASTDVQEALAASKAELDEKSTDINAFRALEVNWHVERIFSSALIMCRWISNRRSRITGESRRTAKTSLSIGVSGMRSSSWSTWSQSSFISRAPC